MQTLSLAIAFSTVGGAASAQMLAPPGATSCSGCHAPVALGVPVPSLLGYPADAIVAAMDAYRSGRRDGTIMGRIARGFSDDETRAIAAWLSVQH